MPVTLKDVAKRAGVSVPTASLILNGTELPFAPATRQAVLDAAEALQYRPDAAARRNATGSHRRDAIAMLLRNESPSRVANSPVYEMTCGVNDVLVERNQFLVMTTLQQFESPGGAPPRIIAERFADGLIVENGLPAPLEEAVERYKIPAIWLNTGRHLPGDCVYSDEVHAARIVTEHLAELGHTRIAFLAPLAMEEPTAHYSIHDRIAGYRQAMSTARLEPLILRERVGEQAVTLREVIEAIVSSRRGDRPITAVATYDITLAVRLRCDLQSAGLDCPRDVSIIAADDLRYVRRMWPDMAGITCDRYRMGRCAAEMILAKIASGPQPSQVFKGSLIRGATVGPAITGHASPRSAPATDPLRPSV